LSKEPARGCSSASALAGEKGGPMGTHAADNRAPGKVPGALKAENFV